MVAEEVNKHSIRIPPEVPGDLVPFGIFFFLIICNRHSTARSSGSWAGSWQFPKSEPAEPQVRHPGPGSQRFRF
jgi:hypothetical protein